MNVDVIIEDKRWTEVRLNALAAKSVRTALSYLEFDATNWAVAVLACDDARIAALNKTFRGKPTATNVLSWPSAERAALTDGNQPSLPSGGAELGDIAIAFDTCQREAAELSRPLEDHATHLIVHGTLHLLGYDHERDGDAALMESTETAILYKLGVPDPYG